MKGRALKQKILQLLSAQDFNESLAQIGRLPARQVVNPLFSFFYHGDTLLKWRAVSAMGVVVAALFECNPESARVIMRRLMWNLNDESGGIGWGSPEAMGEIMACSESLAGEFSRILVSYIDPCGNYLEHEILQRGVLWGLGRLAGVRSSLLTNLPPFVLPFLNSDDPFHRGLGVWIGGLLKSRHLFPIIESLSRDEARLTIYRGRELQSRSVARLAVDALVAFG